MRGDVPPMVSPALEKLGEIWRSFWSNPDSEYFLYLIPGANR